MSETEWFDRAPPSPGAIGPAGWLRVALRGTAAAGLLVGGLVVLLTLRLVERPAFGERRPITPWITQGVCRGALAIIGLRRRVSGTPARQVAAVANHSSWLDILVLNAGQRVCFVSKSDVRSWPGIGWLARATGTVFIDRDARSAGRHRELLRERLAQGHALLFFPEGTSTDGRRVLPFRSSLFSVFFDAGVADGLRLQPVSVVYHAPEGADPRFYGWWSKMDLAPHLLAVLAAPRQGSVGVTYHLPLLASDHGDRKRVAHHCERVIRAEVTRALEAQMRPPAVAPTQGHGG